MILLKSKEINFQFGYHNMYLPEFKNAIFIDVTPSFCIEEGRGRIIMVQWNNFLRQIKFKLRKIMTRKKIEKHLLKKSKLITFYNFKNQKLDLMTCKKILDYIL